MASLLIVLLSLLAQTPKTASFLPSVSVSLPPGVLSETVQISYFLVGPFGGYGGYVAQRAGVHSYEIPTMVEGKDATEIRMIVYASGCEIQQFVLPLAEHSRVNQEFQCQRAETVRLSGKIVPTALVSDNNAELVVTYMASWAHGFYGITDGIVTEFHLATVSPDAKGMFEVDLPYFSADDAEASSPQHRASFRLMLRDSKTWNLIAPNLEPEKQELRLEEHSLRIQSYYPDDLLFTAEHFVQIIVIKGKVFRSDSGEAISNSYIQLTSEEDEAKHFDTRTDEKGDYLFGVPAGDYTVTIYAWFRKRSEVPCQNPLEQKTVDGGDITVEWQWKSQAFMEVVTLKGFSIGLGRENVKDFDLVGR